MDRKAFNFLLMQSLVGSTEKVNRFVDEAGVAKMAIYNEGENAMVLF